MVQVEALFRIQGITNRDGPQNINERDDISNKIKVMLHCYALKN